MELQQRYKKVRFFTCPKTFFTWASIDFPLYDDEDEEEEENGQEEDKEEEYATNDFNKYHWTTFLDNS